MTYKELYDKALWDLEHDKITLGEFEKMIEPLNKEIQKEEQTDGDLISRDFMKKLGATCIAKRSETGELVAISNIDILQSAEKTAEWVMHPKTIYAHLVCNKCLSNAPYDCKTRYCPNCGAKMKGVE